jgi:Ca2+-transporting ATPase
MKNSEKASTVVQIVHAKVRGRCRYQVKGLRRCETLKRYLEFKLSTAPGIDYVRANILTGNILLRFEAKIRLGIITSLVQKTVLEYIRNPELVIKQLNQREEKSTAVLLSEPWHLKGIDTIVAELDTSSEKGLSREAREKKLREYGANILTESQPRAGLSIFIDYFKSGPVALLSLAAGLSVLTGGIADAIVIMGVVTINAILGYATESQSEKIIHSLKHLINPSAWVIREGKRQEVDAREITMGDILILKPGCYIPADARLIQAQRLSIDESALTGESIPISKKTTVLTQPNIPLAERVNMVYRGTFVTGGQGLAVVVATGKYSEMGRIQTLVGETTIPQTPMERQLEQAGEQLVWLSSAVCGVVLALGLVRGYGLLSMVKTSISLAVAAVPEGLPTVATTTLALGIHNMRQHKVLIRRLDAVEALGSVQAICLDKTGTLTANRMSVVQLLVDDQIIKITEGQFWSENTVVNPYNWDKLLKLIHISVLCNDTKVSSAPFYPSLPSNNHSYTLNGSATENALIEMAIAAGVNIFELKAQYPRLKTKHRSVNHNFMVTVHKVNDSEQLIAVKGNPTEVLELCNGQVRDGQHIPLTEEDRQALEENNERMAGQALRVLGFAYGYTKNVNTLALTQDNLIWLGLMGIADPIRPGVKDVISKFHQAGINTLMITGDQSPTAYAIGKELNLSQEEALKIVESNQLADLDPEVMKGLCDSVHIFARISPAYKLQIVQALQHGGKVVAMTGDGINDTPALKAAEVGIAMGHTGTDVAREVADVVLEDDNLETTIVAISQGRTIYNNIRKSVHFLLSTNLSEITVMLLANAGGLGQPLNAMQLLWLNLVTDIFPGLALALEAPEPDVLRRPPRPPEEPIIQSADFHRIAVESTTISTSALSAYGYGILRYGISPRSSTIAFMSLVTGQLFHALSCRSAKPLHSVQLPANPYLTTALAGSLTLQFMSLVVPGLRNLLHVTPINLLDGIVIGTSALLPLAINEQTKPQEKLIKKERRAIL